MVVTLVALTLFGWVKGPPPAEMRGKPFWLAVAKDCAVPAGESAVGLVREAVAFLGSPDSVWRDDVGYGVAATCVYGKKLLKPEERRERVAQLSMNLRRGIGEAGTDLLSVVRRPVTLPEPPPTSSQAAAREKVLATLQQIRR